MLARSGAALLATAATATVAGAVGAVTGSQARVRLINYLNQISGNHSLSGVTSRPNFLEFNNCTVALGFDVALAQCDPWIFLGGIGSQDFSFQSRLLQHSNAGGIIGMSVCMPNPITGGSCFDGGSINASQISQNGTPQNNSLKAVLDIIANGLQPYKNAGKAVIFRPYFEMDGNWFWWGFQNFSTTDYVNLYRFTRDYLVVTKGLDNLLFMWGVNCGPGSYEGRYPGDNWTDGVGMDAYTNDPAGV
jgi:mannan endo-1,4-beta-mannosidase